MLNLFSIYFDQFDESCSENFLYPVTSLHTNYVQYIPNRKIFALSWTWYIFQMQTFSKIYVKYCLGQVFFCFFKMKSLFRMSIVFHEFTVMFVIQKEQMYRKYIEMRQQKLYLL
jgi:hypothetical protein